MALKGKRQVRSEIEIDGSILEQAKQFNYLGCELSLDRCSTLVMVLCYKSEGRWFDPTWCQWNFHWHEFLPIAL